VLFADFMPLPPIQSFWKHACKIGQRGETIGSTQRQIRGFRPEIGSSTQHFGLLSSCLGPLKKPIGLPDKQVTEPPDFHHGLPDPLFLIPGQPFDFTDALIASPDPLFSPPDSLFYLPDPLLGPSDSIIESFPPHRHRLQDLRHLQRCFETKVDVVSRR